MTSSPAPSVDRRRLRAILRHERDTARMTQDQVATAMDWSLSKVIRIESGAVKISTNDLRALLDLYRVSDDRRDELLELARASRKPPWWAEYREHLSPAFVYYIGLEPNAAEIRYFHSTLIPGIVQTETYARACLAGTALEPLSDETMERRLNVRMRRQSEFFDQPNPPQLHVVLDESAVRRVVGDRQTMREQLHHLVELTARAQATIQVIPFEHGIHVGTSGPYIIIDFPDPDAVPVLYFEGAFDDEIIKEKPDAVDMYRKSFRQLQMSALGPVESMDFIRRVAEELA